MHLEILLILAFYIVIAALLWHNADTLYDLQKSMHRKNIPLFSFGSAIGDRDQWIKRFRVSLIVFFFFFISLLLYQVLS